MVGGVANSPSAPSPSGSLPPAGRSGTGHDSRQSQQHSQEINEDRDGSRKRTASGKWSFGANLTRASEHSKYVLFSVEREKEVDSAAAGSSSAEVASNQPMKRPKINRNRYTGSHGAVMRKMIDQHTGENKGQRRHD